MQNDKIKFQDYSQQEIKILKKLSSPKKIQDFVNGLKANYEKNGQTCMSPRMVIKTKKAHCMEGALFAAAALEVSGHKPLVVDLKAVKHDFDHVIAVFKINGRWGAISKTNHAVLRYREPVYDSVRELVMSYFHEYFDDQGRKNLREYSNPFDLSYFNKLNWRITEEDLFEIPAHLDDIKHFKILLRRQIKSLRKADKIEIKAGKLVEFKK